MSAHFHQLLQESASSLSKADAVQRYSLMPDSYRAWVDEATFVDFFTSASRASFYFHDYEAGGTDPAVDIPLQHAGVRVDMQLRIIDEPNDWYCKPAGDRLPHPQAILLTGISLKHVAKVGLDEPSFFRKIKQEMSVPMTCNTGYNSLKYDDEMTRFGFYRNLIPSYEHEYLNGNSRWDLLALTAAVAAWDPEHYIWPLHPETGLATLKLEFLAKANGLTQENAHNAVDDVLATVQWARCLREKSPGLFNYCYARRTKAGISKELAVGSLGLIASPMYREQGYAVPVFVIGQPLGSDKNKFICLDLSDIGRVRSLWKLARNGVAAVAEQLYMKSVDAPEDFVRLPIVQTAINKCPMFVPSTHPIGAKTDWSVYADLLRAIQTPEGAEFKRVVISACSSDFENAGEAAEIQLYSGFPSKKDQVSMQMLSHETLPDVFKNPCSWDDPRYAELWALARCKYLGEEGRLRDPDSQTLWDAHCHSRLNAPLQRNPKHQCVTPVTLIAELEKLGAQHLLEEYQVFWPQITVGTPGPT